MSNNLYITIDELKMINTALKEFNTIDAVPKYIRLQQKIQGLIMGVKE